LFTGYAAGILLLLLGSSSGPLSGLFGGISSSSPLGDGKNILSFFGASGYGSIVYGSIFYGYTFSSGIYLSSSSSSIS